MKLSILKMGQIASKFSFLLEKQALERVYDALFSHSDTLLALS